MNSRITDWSGKRVCLLGASTGIGPALGSVLLAHGARVALSARNAARLAEVAAAGGGQALVAFPAMPSTTRACAPPGTPCWRRGAVSMLRCTWRGTMCRCAPGNSIRPKRGG